MGIQLVLNSGLWRAHLAEATTELSRYGPGHLLYLIAKWRERSYFRKELRRLVQDAPHLIDDIGLTMFEAVTEIEKPFWQPCAQNLPCHVRFQETTMLT